MAKEKDNFSQIPNIHKKQSPNYFPLNQLSRFNFTLHTSFIFRVQHQELGLTNTVHTNDFFEISTKLLKKLSAKIYLQYFDPQKW